MCYIGDNVGVGFQVCRALLGQAGAVILPADSVLFSPVKLGFIVIWVYLCMYCIRRIQPHPLVPEQYKAIVNVFSLLSYMYIGTTQFSKVLIHISIPRER